MVTTHKQRIIAPLFKLLDENYKATAKHMTIEATVDEHVFLDLLHEMDVHARHIQNTQQGEWLLIDRGTRGDIVVRKLRDAAMRYPLSLQPLVGTEKRVVDLTNALREALKLAADALDEADENSDPEAPPTHNYRAFVEAATAKLAELQKVLEEK